MYIYHIIKSLDGDGRAGAGASGARLERLTRTRGSMYMDSASVSY